MYMRDVKRRLYHEWTRFAVALAVTVAGDVAVAVELCGSHIVLVIMGALCKASYVTASPSWASHPGDS